MKYLVHPRKGRSMISSGKPHSSMVQTAREGFTIRLIYFATFFHHQVDLAIFSGIYSNLYQVGSVPISTNNQYFAPECGESVVEILGG